MKLVFEVPDQALQDFGKQVIEKEVKDSLKWLYLRRSCVVMAENLRTTWQESDYETKLAEIRAETWQEYKQDLEL
ncbi:MAG: hypothetical protein KME09_22425 [Pleurocapsa minor HA4230-MV1]|jgi:hypothetical protein|nr:hypothetical protein [Pleurocapsa minor HA4230-MV1]